MDASFMLEGSDDDGFVWICDAAGRDVWCHNLGPVEQVREFLGKFLRSLDDVESSKGSA